MPDQRDRLGDPLGGGGLGAGLGEVGGLLELGELGELADVFGAVARFQRVLGLQLGDHQFEEVVLAEFAVRVDGFRGGGARGGAGLAAALGAAVAAGRRGGGDGVTVVMVGCLALVLGVRACGRSGLACGCVRPRRWLRRARPRASRARAWAQVGASSSAAESAVRNRRGRAVPAAGPGRALPAERFTAGGAARPPPPAPRPRPGRRNDRGGRRPGARG